MRTRTQLLVRARTKLSQAGVTASPKEVEWLLLEALGISAIDLLTEPNGLVETRAEANFETMLERRLRHEPVQYILGYTDFYGLRFQVDSSVLIPRPETELLVEKALNMMETYSNPSIVDIGTGSGCIAVAIKIHKPDARVMGIDISSRALQSARTNAINLNAQIEWLEADLFSTSLAHELNQNVDFCPIDLLVSNPPYVPEEERGTLAPEVGLFEPEEALFVKEDANAYYRALADLACEVLTDNGCLLLEIHADGAESVKKALMDRGLTELEISKDLAGRDRMVSARIRR